MRSTLHRKIKLQGTNDSAEVRAVFALNIRETYIRLDIAKKLGRPTPCSRPLALKIAGSEKRLPATHYMALEFDLDGHTVDWSCKVAPELPCETVIGNAMMSARRIVLDLVNKDLIVEKDEPEDVLAL
jgi:hypothetical protein